MIKRKPKYRKLFQGGSSVDTSTMDPVAGTPAPFIPSGDITSPYNWAADPASVNDPRTYRPSGFNWGQALGVASRAGSTIVPYASNIANSFRTPPLPSAPQLVNPVTMSRIDLSNARNQILRQTRAQDLNADRALNPQAAAAVRNANLAKSIEGTSQVSEQEAFLNSRQKAEAAGMNLNVDTMNATAMNRWNDAILERNMANQRAQSGNLANASDKYIAQENEDRKAQLDMQKMNVLSQMWKSSGVYDRMLKKMADQGNTDPLDIETQMGMHALGGYTKGRRFSAAEGGSMYARGGTIPYTKGTDLEFEDWFRHNTPEGLAGEDLDQATQDYYGMYRGRGSYQEPINPMRIPGSNPMAIRRPTMHPSYMAFGGLVPASKPFQRRMGRGTGAGMINPFGGSSNKGGIGLGGGIPGGKFSMKNSIAKGSKLFAVGGELYMTPTDTPDMMMNNGHNAQIPGAYAMGGTMGRPRSYMEMPQRPKAIRQMDFAGIEHMAWGGYPLGAFQEDQHNVHYPMGGQMGYIPAKSFESSHIGRSRPTPGPDDVTIGVDLYKKGGWISKAVNPAHKGYCTPMTKSTCTPRRKAFAMTMKKHHGFHKKEDGGPIGAHPAQYCLGGNMAPARRRVFN